jgi:hypothetical protein
MIYEQLQHFLTWLTTNYPTSVEKGGLFLSITNSGKEPKTITLPLSCVIDFVDWILPHRALLAPYVHYNEKVWRAISKGLNPDLSGTPWVIPAITGELNQAFGSQTKPLFCSLVAMAPSFPIHCFWKGRKERFGDCSVNTVASMKTRRKRARPPWLTARKK